MKRRIFGVVAAVALISAVGCARNQHQVNRWSNHPNMLVCAPSRTGLFLIGIPGGALNLCMFAISYPLAMPFGYQDEIKDFFLTNRMLSFWPTTGVYATGTPFYLLFGWWGPGNVSAADLREVADEKNRRTLWFRSYKIRGDELRGANLSGWDLTGCDLSGIDLTGADLSGTKLYRANLSHAIFRDAKLTRAQLQRTYLVGADFRGADLSGADFSGPADRTLSPTSLRGIQLDGANVANTYFMNVEGLTTEVLRRATNWESAHFN